MFCSECGAPLEVGHKFCGNCGSQTDAEVSSQAFAAHPPDTPRAESLSVRSDKKRLTPVLLYGGFAALVLAALAVSVLLSRSSHSPRAVSESNLASESHTGRTVLPRMPTVAPYIFNGAYAIYTIHYGTLSIPLKISIDEVDSTRRTYKGTAAFGDVLADLTSSQTVDFGQGEFALLPPRGLIALLRGTTTPDLKLPTDFHRTGAVIYHEVAVSAPAGSFLTEEVANGQDFAWYEIHSGLLVKIQGPSVAADIASHVPDVPRPTSATIELVTTNVLR